jgi:hypothetical protein
MSEGNIHLALFDEIDPAILAIEKLRDLGVPDKEMTIISSVPYTEKILGRPITWTVLPKLAIGGFFAGMIASLLLNLGTPLQYPIRVGNMPYLPIPTTIILTFEMSMLGLLVFTFLGVIWENAFPSFGPKEYRKEVSDGKIALVFTCPSEIHTQAHTALADLGAEWMHRTEATQL